jgi:predicted dienelactone hydrolase
MRVRPVAVLTVILTVAMAIAGCSSSTSGSSASTAVTGGASTSTVPPAPTSTATPSTTEVPPTTAPTTSPPPTTASAASPDPVQAYTGLGPHAAGVTELTLGDRPVTVFYPTDSPGPTPATYDMRAFLPPADQGKVTSPAGAVFTMDATVDPPVSSAGPFPLVVFSHGLAGFRQQSSFLATHLAEWGYIVAAPEHRSRDLTAILSGKPDTSSTDVADLGKTIDLMLAQNAPSGGRFAGLIDDHHIAAVGHSAGGVASYSLAKNDPRISTYVEMAAGVPTPTTAVYPKVPVLFIAGSSDVIAQLPGVQASYDAAPAPKRLAVLDRVTHLGFMDVCTLGRDQGGVLQIAATYGVTVPALVLRLYADGCDGKYLAAEQDWPIINHLVTAQLRLVFGQDAHPVGLGPELNTAPLATKVTYSEQLG